jgi:1,6-anhydro-N-acetylmuramate kinase
MDIRRTLKKVKSKRLMVISAAGMQSGVQGIYFEASGLEWHVIAGASITYPAKVSQLIEQISQGCAAGFSSCDIAALDRKTTLMCVDCAKAMLANTPRTQTKPHAAVLNRLSIFRGTMDDGSPWIASVVDVRHVAEVLGVPVLTDISQHGLMHRRSSELPLQAGITRIANRATMPFALVNIGLASRVFLTDPSLSDVLTTDAGPGMRLVNRVASECGLPDGFDRDGLQARQGKVDPAALEALTAMIPATDGPVAGWAPQDFEAIVGHPALSALPSNDKLATITALSARAIALAFGKHARLPAPLPALWVSGGGAHNLAFRDYLGAFFDRVPVKSVEEIGIPVDTLVPLALGLSVHTWLEGDASRWGQGLPTSLGAWVSV